MPELKALLPAELDGMVLELFQDWGHIDWFWRNASDGRQQDALLKSNMTRSTQIARVGHREESILNWVSVDSPRILFVAAMVFSSPDDVARKAQAEGLFPAIAQRWEPQAINQAFTWMQGHNSDNWSRCRKAVKKEQGRLEMSEFALMDNLSAPLQDCLNLCSDLGIKPTLQILQQQFSHTEHALVDIGLLL